MLESTLRVVASDSQNSSVTCTNGTDLGIATFTFTVLCEFYILLCFLQEFEYTVCW